MDKDNTKNNNSTNVSFSENNKENNKKDNSNNKNFFKKIFLSFKNKNKNRNNLELLETNLIKDEVEIKFYWKKDVIIFSILLFIVFIIILESYIFLSWWENKRGEDYSHYLDKEIASIKEEASNLKEDYDKSLNFNKRLSISSSTFKKHIYWTKFFSFLEANTLKNIYYKSFSGDISGKYILPAVADDVRAINFQSRAFLADPMIMSASVSDEEIINDEKSQKTFINFNFNFNLNNKIFN